MQKNDLQVLPRPNGTWVMQRDGSSRALSTHDTKRAALTAGRQLATRDGVDLTIRDRRGWISENSTHVLEELARWEPAHDLILRQRSRPA